MRLKLAIKLVAILMLFGAHFPVGALESSVVFYLDQHYHPVVRLDRIQSAPEGVHAILALYALANGAGCEGKNQQGLVNCALTRRLGLGTNCSPQHIDLVRAWFEITPNLTSRWSERWNKQPQQVDALETLCYRQPDTGSWQNIWEIIRVSTSNGIIAVEAVQAWGSQNGHGRVRYRNSYKISGHRVEEISAEVIELESSSKSIFESETR